VIYSKKDIKTMIFNSKIMEKNNTSTKNTVETMTVTAFG
jgi:hypothetical protein